MRVRKAKKPKDEGSPIALPHKRGRVMHPRDRKGEKSKGHKNLGLRKPSGPLMKSQETQVREAALTRLALQLTTSGYTADMVAEHLGITKVVAQKYIAEGLQEYRGDIEELAGIHLAKSAASLDMLARAWMVEATGGQQVDPVTGETVRVKKNAEAARMILRAVRERTTIARVLMPQRVDIKNSGTPGAVPGEDEADRLWRKEFGGAVLPSSVEEKPAKESDDGDPVH